MNLIRNSDWRYGCDENPEFFSGTGYSYDELRVNGCRTCSVTMEGYCDSEVCICYELPIDVRTYEAITWGCVIRAVEADCIELVAEFCGRDGELIKTRRKNIARRVGYDFSRAAAMFQIPCEAKKAKLSICFSGKVTACTCCAPFASFE